MGKLPVWVKAALASGLISFYSMNERDGDSVVMPEMVALGIVTS